MFDVRCSVLCDVRCSSENNIVHELLLIAQSDDDDGDTTDGTDIQTERQTDRQDRCTDR